MEEKRPASPGTLTGNISVSDSIEHSLYTDWGNKREDINYSWFKLDLWTWFTEFKSNRRVTKDIHNTIPQVVFSWSKIASAT